MPVPLARLPIEPRIHWEPVAVHRAERAMELAGYGRRGAREVLAEMSEDVDLYLGDDEGT